MTTRFDEKAPGDQITVQFDFGALAAAVTSPTVSIAVLSGADPSASAMLDGDATVVGASVLQRIRNGVAGVDYGLVCLASNGDDRYSLEAVLPVRDRPTASAAVPVYVTEADFERRFGAGELADLLADGSSYAEAENDAASLVNGYLGTRYTLPLLSVPAMVKGWAGDVTRFKLWDEHAPEEVRRRYEDALAQLKQLAQGLIALPPGSDGTPAASGLVFDGYSADRVFTTDSLAGF